MNDDGNPTYLGELRARLEVMGDPELLRYGIRAKYMCGLEANEGDLPLETYVVQLRESSAEWKRRHQASVIANSF
jgi:hypothetical protein